MITIRNLSTLPHYAWIDMNEDEVYQRNFNPARFLFASSNHHDQSFYYQLKTRNRFKHLLLYTLQQFLQKITYWATLGRSNKALLNLID